MFKAGVFVFVILFAAISLNAELYNPKKKTTLAPLSQEEFQQMLEERTEKHACMKKASEAMGSYKYNLLQSYTEPTPNQYDYDAIHYEINIELDFTNEFISGYSKMTFSSLKDGLDFIDINLGSIFAVSQVVYNDSINITYNWADWFYIRNFLPEQLDSGEQASITVYYSGYPNDAQYMRFYQDMGLEICYTSVEPFGARFWWACKDFPFDKPDSVDIIITHPTNYTVASNGLLQSITDNGNGTSTTHWHESYPIATYLVTIGVTDYNKFDQFWEYAPGDTLPIEQYYFPGAGPSQQWSSAYYFQNYTIPSLEALSYWFTLYPFIEEKYGHNHYGWGGAMEHQTLTSISPYFNTEYVIAHEAAHHWGGDLVTCRNFHHMWLNEGFASYSEVLYFRYHYGGTFWKQWLFGQRHLDAGTPYVENLELDNVFDGTTVYDKGSWLFYMLHMILGDDKFREAMDLYFHDPDLEFASAVTADLNRICSQVYGEDMSWFFNSWVYQEGNPFYSYSFMNEPNKTKDGYIGNLFIDQVQPYETFIMPIDIVAFAGGYDTSFTVFNNLCGQLYQLQLPAPLDSVWLDPDDKILCEKQFEPGFGVHVIGQVMPRGNVGTPYHEEIEAIGGVPPYSWSKTFGQIPYGLDLDLSGEVAILDGIPTFASNYTFTLKVEDSSTPPQSSSFTFKVNIDPPLPICGDTNGDQDVTLSDAVFLINYIYLGGDIPDPEIVGDVNCDGKISLPDVVYIINYVFKSGGVPCANCPLEFE